MLLMSSFSVFDFNGGEFRGPKAISSTSGNGLQMVSTSGNGPRKEG